MRRLWATAVLIIPTLGWLSCSSSTRDFTRASGGDAQGGSAGEAAATGDEAGADTSGSASTSGASGAESSGAPDGGSDASGGSHSADAGAAGTLNASEAGQAGAGMDTCSDEETYCAVASACTTPETDVKNCGGCGHDCGALSACIAGRCQVATIISGLSYAQGMDVSSKGVFFTTNNTIQYCPNPAKCANTQKQIGSPAAASFLAVTKTLATDAVAFYGKNGLPDKFPAYYSCPISGCGIATLTVASPDGGLSGLTGIDGDLYFQSSGSADASMSAVGSMTGKVDGTQGARLTIGDRAAVGKIAVDSKYVYYVRVDTSDGRDIVACSRSTGCSSYIGLETGDPTNFAAYGGVLYWLNGFMLNRVEASDPTSNTTVAYLPAGYDKDMLVDESNIYWLTESSIVYCALPSCVGGVMTLVSGLAGATTLRQEGASLYWLIPSELGDATGGIYRVAKP